MHIRPARSEEELKEIESLSWEIFHEHYDSYMDPDHVEFYLDKYQRTQALKDQLKLNYFHYLIQVGRTSVGFITIQELDQSLRISKLYLHKSARDRGIGENMLDFVEDQAEERGKKVIDLIVNRRNEGGIRFYKRGGFEIAEELTHTYENGHTEEDYLMKRTL